MASLRWEKSDEIFTDIDSYNPNEVAIDDENVTYDENQPWGYEDNDVVVNLNLYNDPFWGGGFNNWGWGFNNGWAFGGWNAWGGA